MKVKQMVLCCVVAFVTVVVSLIVFWTRGYDYINQLNAEKSLEMAQLFADILEDGGYLEANEESTSATLSQFAHTYSTRYDARICVLDLDGNVLADSDAAEGDIFDSITASKTTDVEGTAIGKENSLIQAAFMGKETAEVSEGFTWALNTSHAAVPLRFADFRGALYVEQSLYSLSELNSELMKQIILGFVVCLAVIILLTGILRHKVKLPVKVISDEEDEKQKHPYGKSLKQFDGDADKEMRFGAIVINMMQKVVMVNGVVTEMPRKEFELLVLLAQNCGRVYSRELLLDKVWGYQFSGETRTVDVHIKNLRKKIEEDARNPKYIVTVRGYGYKFCC